MFFRDLVIVLNVFFNKSWFLWKCLMFEERKDSYDNIYKIKILKIYRGARRLL